MASVLFSNNASGVLAASYTDTATALTLTAGQGVRFPAPSGGDYFYATIVDSSNNIEIIKCTTRTGDTLTVVRGQEGTTPMELSAGFILSLRVTAAGLGAIRDQTVPTAKLEDAAVTTQKLADAGVSAPKLADGAVTTSKVQDASITSGKLASGAALANLGYTPIQQGGGTGQDSNKLYIGWKASSVKLSLQVDTTDYGYILTEQATAPVGSAGYRGTPQQLLNANTTFTLSLAGGQAFHDSFSNHTWTIPDDATVPFDVGSAIMLVDVNGIVTLAVMAGVILVWAPTGVQGPRTMGTNSMATLSKIGPNKWIVAGCGLT